MIKLQNLKMKARQIIIIHLYLIIIVQLFLKNLLMVNGNIELQVVVVIWLSLCDKILLSFVE